MSWMNRLKVQFVILLLLWLVPDSTQLMSTTVKLNSERLAGSGGVVRIGHLQPNNPNIAHEPEILKMCARDLKERKILPINYTLTVITMESCNKFSGVEHAAYLHYIKNATIYFGPGCNNVLVNNVNSSCEPFVVRSSVDK
ncbi:hypothetical protein ANCDUO_03123 [Ancylostoma duodenale]|uniref:Uncharacterized protein n=1 Tax=Ancylostoma duodenale TaxID=51022 RepID=A0A0C2D9Y6_9BILA|nr:hypothetical protein ANCDUO_03123 [Ancylostoma duodenale]